MIIAKFTPQLIIPEWIESSALCIYCMSPYNQGQMSTFLQVQDTQKNLYSNSEKSKWLLVELAVMMKSLRVCRN